MFYCWMNVETAEKYLGILGDAIKKWEPALYPNSALSIELHPVLNGDPRIPCDQLPNPSGLCVLPMEAILVVRSPQSAMTTYSPTNPFDTTST